MSNYKFCGWNMVYGIRFLVLSCVERERDLNIVPAIFFFFFFFWYRGLFAYMHTNTHKNDAPSFVAESCGKVENAYFFDREGLNPVRLLNIVFPKYDDTNLAYCYCHISLMLTKTTMK
jgi:hypothetical protein